MIKACKQLFPVIAVFFVAAFMHQLRVNHFELNAMLSLILLYMIGMVAGVFCHTISKDQAFIDY